MFFNSSTLNKIDKYSNLKFTKLMKYINLNTYLNYLNNKSIIPKSHRNIK